VEHPRLEGRIKADLWADLESPCCLGAFDKDSVDGILMSHTFEHLDNLENVIDECWRVLKPGAKLLIVVPHASTPALAFGDMTHRHFFTLNAFKHLTEGEKCSYYNQKRKWRLKGTLKWRKVRKRGFAWIGWLSAPVDALINVHPLIQQIAETYLSYVFMGFNEVEVELEPVK
jgi:SAM-dependent methyltransferase